ncbi:hypothetical protein [Streptomyces anandii]|uniref:hypothetical protein n=1 Tax=Streptomyces anandii TaxID=285454 RepID=UPI0037BA97DB
MSTSITFHCNHQWQHGICAVVLITDAHNLEAARSTARGRGWRTHPDGNDYCPSHSGAPARPTSTNVVTLRSVPTTMPDDGPVLGPRDVLQAAVHYLDTVASTTDVELATNPYWHRPDVPRRRWFAHGVENVLGGPPGELAALLNPPAARLLARILQRYLRPKSAPTGIPAEAYLLARNLLDTASRDTTKDA